MSKQIYESRYGATRKITAEARLAEIACERMARGKGESLPLRFWDDPAWRSAFRIQMRHATSLAKVYDLRAVFKALESNPGVFSLGFAGLTPYIEAEQRRLDAIVGRARDAAPVEAAPADSAPRREVAGGKSLRSKLKGL